jgi:hypothetical protein
MAARQAVLETPEMLENITIYIRAHQIRPLKSVSRFWSQHIKTSPAIRNAQCITPTGWSRGGHIPIYEIESKTQIKFHRKLFPAEKFNNAGQVCRTKSSDIRSRKAIQLASYRAEYATFPKCRCLFIYLPRFPQNHCVVYNKDGIKISAIIGARASLIQAFYSSTQPHRWDSTSSTRTLFEKLEARIIFGESLRQKA